MKTFLTFFCVAIMLSLSAQAQNALTPKQKQNFTEGANLVKAYLPKTFSSSPDTKCSIYSRTTLLEDAHLTEGMIEVLIERPSGNSRFFYTLNHHDARWSMTSYASPDLPKVKEKWDKNSEIGKIAVFINDCFNPDKTKTLGELLPNLK